MQSNVDNPITGHDDNVSWDGRKTADFEKISNDGLWAWNGVEWQPRKITEQKNLQYLPEQVGEVSPRLGDVSDDGFWRWNGTMWVPREAEPQRSQQDQIIQPVKMQIDSDDLAKFPGWSKENINQYLSNGWTIEQLKEYYDGQVVNHYKPVVDNQMSVMMVKNTKKPKKLVWITLGALLPIIVIFLIFVGMVFANILNVMEEEDQSQVSGTWYNPEDTLTLYSNGTASESTGVIVAWDISNGNLSTTFFIGDDEVDIFWKYEIISTSNNHRMLVMAPFTDIEDGEIVVNESSCIGYLDTIKGAERDYFNNQLASFPSWCDPD